MDLLAAEGTAALTIRDDARRGVHVEGATEEPVTGPLATYQLFTRGSANRRVGETAMNRESSRSHRCVAPPTPWTNRLPAYTVSSSSSLAVPRR